MLLCWSCERDYMFRGGSDGLAFSSDTIMFDTIFTSIGSTTRNFRVYNTYGNDMTIEDIRLAGGEDSKFRININGDPGPELSDVTIRSNDSIFIFVEVTIDPAGSDAPFVEMDSIIFYTRERIQSVKLVAYGQDVVLLKRKVLDTQTFTNQKPYLIYDYIHVDTTATLTIEAGARLHFYKDANLIVSGSLEVKGTRDEPVIFTGSRLEDWYSDKPGQWGDIWLMPGSSNHAIDYAIIKNGTRGLVVDSVGLNGDPPVKISNTRIEHKTHQGLVAQTSSIVVSNSLFADCGSASVALTVGGNYEFYFCTIANYYQYQWGFRGTPALVISNYYIDEDGNTSPPYPLENALFSNCIIYGQLLDEIKLDFVEQDDDEDLIAVRYQFDHSLLRTQPPDLKSGTIERYTDLPFYKEVIFNRDPFFISPNTYNYQLDTLSVAKDSGDKDTALRFPVDILGNNRLDDDGPDLGFVERIEIQ